MTVQLEGANTIMNASNEWSNRPADERFNSLEALHDYCKGERVAAGAASIADADMKARAVNGQIVLNGKTSQAQLTNWAFGQLCVRADAPAAYLRKLPAELAAENINHGLAASTGTSRVLIRRGKINPNMPSDSLLPTIRAVTSDEYTRIWNVEITERLLALKHSGRGWQEAPAAFDGSRGQYAGDRDMFSFMVDNDRRIFETGPGGGLSRGFFVSNSETGRRKFVVTSFNYEFICGNHRVWGAKNIFEISVRHIGDAVNRAFDGMAVKLKQYVDSSTVEDERRILSARTYVLGKDKDDLLDTVLGIKNLGVGKKLASEAYDLAVKREDWYGNPHSAWGYAGALTEIARDLPNADDRYDIDRAGGKIMELAF